MVGMRTTLRLSITEVVREGNIKSNTNQSKFNFITAPGFNDFTVWETAMTMETANAGDSGDSSSASSGGDTSSDDYN